MTEPDPDYYAHTPKAVEGRQSKARAIAQHLHRERRTLWDVLALVDEIDRKAVEKHLKLRTSHRDELWQLVVEGFEWLVTNRPHPTEAEFQEALPVTHGGPDESEEDRATECRCILPSRNPKHLAWHRLVIEQGGPAGLVNLESLRAARGMRTEAPNDTKTAEKNRKLGKTTSAEIRKKLRAP